jgi:hypothetical protein
LEHPIFNGRAFRVVYLEDSKRVLKNEAIDIEILSGKHAGFHDSLDARPREMVRNSSWSCIGCFGFFGPNYRKDDAISVPSDDGGAPSI